MLAQNNWLFLIIWFIIAIIMATFFRRVWWFFGAVAFPLIIESFRVCQELRIWLLIGGIICILVAIPLVLKDYKESRQQSLRDIIEFTQNVKCQSAFHQEQELERLEQMSIWSMVISWFKKGKQSA
jgi:hypothetical protein